LKKMSLCTKGYAEIHIQRPFFDNKLTIKIAYKKLLD
jgi:hypothetical protein